MVSFLEAENPTARAAESMSLLGRWELAFCGVNRGLKVPGTQGQSRGDFVWKPIASRIDNLHAYLIR